MRHTLSASVSLVLAPAMLFPPMLWAIASDLSAQTARDVAGEQSAIMERFEPPLTAQPKIKVTVRNDDENASAKKTERVRSEDEKAR